ncbi:Hypothetical protein SRAE_X000174800 [Strongyloides ratti]|uniref:Uncharacterized protein n=1 Tax=Strongyloides ratti TaxID=34506 RepID=A0A090KXM5_STRRB|nr:Hypothetical protein SRAE_X000174800 [Strongyloides ratti]CEF60008.1 Hypothetical protein SRAE_X000174800 [Strongyloides ratti]
MENEECKKLEGYRNIEVYGLTESVKKIFNITFNSMGEIIKKLTEFSYDTSSLLKDSKELNGIDTITWMGCKNSTFDDKKIQVMISYSGQRTQQKPYDSKFSNPVPYEISIIEYKDIKKDNLTEAEINSNVLLSIVEIEKSSEKKKYLDILPPRMSFCKNFPISVLPKNIPNNFEAKYKMYNNVNNKISNIGIFYSKKYDLSSYVLEDNFNFIVPFIGKYEGKNKYKKVKIIQDFIYGYEYILSEEDKKCLNVKELSTDFINTGTKNNLIYLKDPQNFMLDPLGDNFYYYGSIKTNINLTFDSYVAKDVNGGIIEVLYTNDYWKFNDLSGPILHTINYKSPSVNYKLELVSFKNTTNELFSSINYDISSCLEILDNSYYYIKIKNTTTKIIQNLGLQNVYDELSYTLSNNSQVSSPLRFTNYFIRQSDEDVLIFFSISNKINIIPSSTIHFRNQTTIDEIIANLNSTLTTKEISFQVYKTILTIRRNSFMKNPTTVPQPSPSQFVGYTAASLFVSSFFSFAFGVLLGVGGIVFQWKRQRLTNLSYQIFE